MKEGTVTTSAGNGEIIRLLTCSDLRKNLILTLNNNGPASLAELRGYVDASSTAAIHALRELEKDHLTYQDDKRNYKLTNVGAVLALKLENLVKTANVLTEHSSFWLDHDLSGIPKPSLEKLSSLDESFIVQSTATDLFKVYSTFTTLLQNAKEIKGITSILIPDMINVFVTIVPKTKPIELIVTQEVFEKMLELADRSELKKAVEDGKLRLFYLKKNPKVGITVTDYFLSLGLFRWDGMYDYSHDLLSYSTEAIEWGTNLFNHYAASSEEVTASEITS